jgi:mevalonate kinase
MPSTSGSAPGKVILFGEHAVVYGQPAIAVPVHQLAAKAYARPLLRAPSGTIHITAEDIGLDEDLAKLPPEHPLALAIRLTLQKIGVQQPLALLLKVGSTIPLAAGLGSGAAISVAIIRTISAFHGQPLPDADVSALAFEVEKLYHGTPSGIDNTVVTFAKPVYFIKGQPLQTFKVGQPFTLLIADTGIASPTRIAVGDVRTAWQAEPARYDALFARVGALAQQARPAIERGEVAALGPLMDENHALLQELGVSGPELDQLVTAARAAGAQGAKLSGGGRGGNMIALVDEASTPGVSAGLTAAGAKSVISTVVK